MAIKVTGQGKLQVPEVSNSADEPSSSSISLGSEHSFEPPVSVSLACISHVPSWVVYTYLVV